ncbi:MAG: beta-ketoacyl-ACP synthase III [Planctomycetota bacterium]
MSTSAASSGSKGPADGAIPTLPRFPVRIVGTGMALPTTAVSNDDLAKRIDTNDTWITKRTGIQTRYYADDTQTVRDLSREALETALKDANLQGADLDLVILATITPEMACPSTAARVAAEVGANPAGAFDLAAACSGFVYGMNLAVSQLESGRAKRVAVIGAETLSRHINHDDRRTCILFGDAAGCAILEADHQQPLTPTDDQYRGCLHQSMRSDGSMWSALFMPRQQADLPQGVDAQITTEPGWNGQYNTLQMHGQDVFKFAVLQTCDMIQAALDAANLQPEQLKLIVPHQSNQRIMATARDRFGLPEEAMYININRYGNTSAASVPLCLHECRRDGKFQDGDLVLFLAIGGGMTWSTSLWRV